MIDLTELMGKLVMPRKGVEAFLTHRGIHPSDDALGDGFALVGFGTVPSQGCHLPHQAQTLIDPN